MSESSDRLKVPAMEELAALRAENVELRAEVTALRDGAASQSGDSLSARAPETGTTAYVDVTPHYDRLRGYTCVVTGGAGGIGRAIAGALRRFPHVLHMCARRCRCRTVRLPTLTSHRRRTLPLTQSALRARGRPRSRYGSNGRSARARESAPSRSSFDHCRSDCCGACAGRVF